MNTTLRRLLPLVLLLALVLTGRSTTGIDESLEFVSPPTGKKFIRWHGVPGWTYFVQVSDPADHLKTWTFAPIIEGGNNVPISYEIDEPTEGLPDKGFFRLKYTDQVPGTNETLDTADFDGDGLSNKNEVDPGGLLAPTDPLNPDTDGDGLPDGWERAHGLNPNDSSDAANIFPGSNLSNLQAFNAGVRADPNATPTNKDGDGADDIVDADPDDKYVDWGPAGEASYAIVELEQESYGVWSPDSVETTITRKASIGKNGIILYDVSVSHKEPEDDHFIIVSSRTARVWKSGTWSTDLSEQITPKYDVLGAIHRFSALGVCGDHVIGNVDYSNDTADWDPKSGGTRWNLELSNGTTTRIYSPDDVGGSGNSVEGFSDQVAVSPGGALALVSGSKLNSAIAKWRGWFPPGGNASPTYIPGSGASNMQYSYEGNTIEAIEDGGSIVVRKSSGTVISDGVSEFALPNATSSVRNYCICKVAKGNAGDSRLVVGATQTVPNGTDYENGSSLLWIKSGSQVHAAEHTPTIGRVRAIANNGVILGRVAIWRNGQSITLDSLVDYRKVSGPSSATRFTNLVGLAMNGDGAIVATADDQLNQGDGHKTLLALVPVEVLGDNDEDGDIDRADRQARDAHPVILQRKLNKSNTARTLIIRKIGITGLPVKLIMTGDEKVIIKSKQLGTVLMSENQSESSDIGSFVSQADYEITLEGVENGDGAIALKIGDSLTPADPIPIRVLNADVIFRNGSDNLASLIASNVTHGGFDSGDDSIHDIGGSGTETVTVAHFYEAAVTATKRRVSFRQTNYMAGRIWEKIYNNMLGQDFDNPTGSKPWNLFTTSDNYVTSNCLEWLHHQWQRAIHEVHGELQDPQQKVSFESAYYDGANVKPLVIPDLIKTISGNVGVPEAYVAALVLAADFLGKGEINKDVFHNQFEGDFFYFYSGYYETPIDQVPWWVPGVFDLQSEGQLRTITPKSYLESPFYEEVPY